MFCAFYAKKCITMVAESVRFVSEISERISTKFGIRVCDSYLIFIRFEVFTEVIMKNAVFLDVAPCRSCVNRRFRGTYVLHLQPSTSRWFLIRGFLYPEDGGDTFIRNVVFTASHPRRQHSSYYFYNFYQKSKSTFKKRIEFSLQGH
jgi:hypothetical protein